MNYLDLSTYVVQNGSGFMALLCVSTMLLALFAGFCKDLCTDWEEGRRALNVARFKLNMQYAIIAFVFINLLGCVGSFIPSHDKVFAVKISRIKNEALNDENLRAAEGHLEAIVNGLECKYLQKNCEVKKGKK